ncbi:MAG: hypothetical protein WCN81_12905 [Actinomycetes bacterium]
MSAHDAHLEQWRRKLADGTYEDCMDSSALQPHSFCTVFSMCWGSPGGSMVSMLAPEYFDTVGDFVAFVRVVELPRSLFMLTGAGDDDQHPHAVEDYVPVVDAEARPLLQALIAATDAALTKPEPAAADAEAVIAAFNALFGRHGDAQFVASGGVAAVFTVQSIRDQFDAWSADAADLLDEDEPQMIVRRLTDAGELDQQDHVQLEMVQNMLAGFPEF